MSSDSSDDDVVERIRRGRDKERVQRDTSSDARRDLDRRKRSNRARRKHQRRAAESSGSSDSEGSSSTDNDSDSERRRILKKRQPAAREAERRSKTEAEKRKEKLRKLKEQREAQKRASADREGYDGGRRGASASGNVGDLALDIDEEDLIKEDVLPLHQRADFFKMQGSSGGIDDTSPLLSVGEFGLSVESLVHDASGGMGKKDGMPKERSTGQRARTRRSKAWVYVENMANGKFKRVPMSRLGYARLADADDSLTEQNGGTSRSDGPNLMTHRAHDITAFVSGVFQFAQGLLAGLSLLHLFLVQSITLFGTFQSVYQPLANESRRLYFVLSSLGFASAIETYMRESENKELWSTLSVLQKVRILVLGFLYLTTLGLSLVMMPTDTLIAISPADVTPESLSAWSIFEYIR